MTTQAGCDAPNCKNAALIHVTASGEIGHVDAHYCGRHGDMFDAIFPAVYLRKALLVCLTDMDLHGKP